MQFIKNYFNKRNAKSEYKNLLFASLENTGGISQSVGEGLKSLADQSRLEKTDYLPALKEGFQWLFAKVIEDGEISEKERNVLESYANVFGVKTTELGFDQDLFNKYHVAWKISLGDLPNLDHSQVDINFKKGEILHWGESAGLMKLRKRTKRYNYGGMTGSIKICKGFRYRIGSIQVQPVVEEFIDTEDQGIFWITDKRIGFKGERKAITISLDKILATELEDGCLVIFKEGRESPYLFSMDDYEITLAMLSYLLNGPSEMAEKAS